MCDVEKPLSDFHKDKAGKDGHRRECAQCNHARGKVFYWKNIERNRRLSRERRARYKKDRKFIRDWVFDKYKGTPCMDCGGVFDWCAMDFDHRPDETKEFCIADNGSSTAGRKIIARMEKEIAKCDIVCSNCHRVRTRDRKNND